MVMMLGGKAEPSGYVLSRKLLKAVDVEHGPPFFFRPLYNTVQGTITTYAATYFPISSAYTHTYTYTCTLRYLTAE